MSEKKKMTSICHYWFVIEKMFLLSKRVRETCYRTARRMEASYFSDTFSVGLSIISFRPRSRRRIFSSLGREEGKGEIRKASEKFAGLTRGLRRNAEESRARGEDALGFSSNSGR